MSNERDFNHGELPPVESAISEELNLDFRFELARQWVDTALKILEQLEKPLAPRLEELLRNKTALGVARQDETLLFYASKPKFKQEEYVYITPILKQDEEFLLEGSPKREFTSPNPTYVAMFYEDSRAIYLASAEDLSDTTKGLLVLHETCHALIQDEGLIDLNSDDAYWEEEALVYSFEFELLNQLGGNKYIEVLNKISGTIGFSNLNREELVCGYEYDPADADVLKKALNLNTDYEADLWLSVCRKHAYWVYSQKNSDDLYWDFAMLTKKLEESKPN